jgi:chemotaxis response regulator CheB
VRTTKKVALGRRRVAAVLLSVAYDVRAGRSAKLSARPTADGRRLLRRTRRIAAVATATSTGGLPAVRRLTLTR